MIRLLAIAAVLGSTAGCSLLINTDDVARNLELEHQPLFEALGVSARSRPVPVVIRGTKLRDSDTITLISDGDEIACEASCASDAVDGAQICCSGPFAGQGGLSAILVRLPLVLAEENGTREVVVRATRGNRVLGEGLFEFELLEEEDVAPGEVEELIAAGDGVLRFSQIVVQHDAILNVEGDVPARLRIMGSLILESRDPENGADEALVSSFAGACTACNGDEEGVVYPLTGGGPGLDGPGGGALVVRVDGEYRTEDPTGGTDPQGRPLFFTPIAANDGGGGGAAVLSVLGGFQGATPTVTGGDPSESRGAVRVMNDPALGYRILAATSFDEPRLLVATDGRLTGGLPVLTRDADHTIQVMAADTGAYFYVVESGGIAQSFEPSGTAVEVALEPGLNRVCVLVDDIDPLPEELFEGGQCFYSVYLPE